MKILVVILDNLGDTVMATSVIEPLRAIYPNAKIGFWVKEYAAGLLAEVPEINTVHASDPFWDTSPGLPRGKWAAFFKTLGDIHRENYDLAFVLNTEWRRAAACWWAGIPIRVGFDRRKSGFFLTNSVPVPTVKEHFVDDHHVLLEADSGRVIDKKLFVPYLGAAAAKKDSVSIVIHPFAGDPLKCWPTSRWNELLRDLHKRQPKWRFTILCGPGEERHLDPIVQDLPEECFQRMMAPPLPALKSTVKNAALFIGGDSGPGHVAAALGTPVISLFGPTDPDRSGPRGKNKVIIIKKSRIEEIELSAVVRALP